MKHTTRVVALLMGIWMAVSSLASCQFAPSWLTDTEVPESSAADTVPKVSESEPKETSEPETVAETAPETTPESEPEDEKEAVFEVLYPSVSVSTFRFDLTDSDLTEYKSKVTAVRQMFSKNEAGSEDEFEAALYELLSLQAAIRTQRDIAYMLYLYDMSSTAAWDDYLYAYNMAATAENLFFDFYAESKRHSHALADVFKEVVAKEYEGRLVTKYPAADAFGREMTELEGEYNALKNSDVGDEEVFDIYKKYMVAAYGLATASSTEHYYEYAGRYVYYRNDTAAQREALRAYTKEYLIPLCRALKSQSQAADRRLWAYEFELSNRFLENAYDSFSKNFLFDYFASLPKSSGDAMRDAFEKDRVFVGDRDGSYNSAMVMDVGNTPICYFHKSELTMHTVAHEIGHYYAHVMGQKSYFSYDLRETYSTANTMLLYSYISNDLNSNAFISAELYMLYNWMYQVVLSVIKDEFDEQIFSCDPSSLTLADFERIMRGLIDKYGVGDLSTGIVDQLMTYWRRLGIVYPMSNYCYATSMITAFQIYIKSKDDYASACEMYRKVVEEPRERGDFVATIVNAGLTTPYDEATYTELQRLTETE